MCVCGTRVCLRHTSLAGDEKAKIVKWGRFFFTFSDNTRMKPDSGGD